MTLMPPLGRVFIIGAGPGDPGLITVRGVRLLAMADVVVYDRAVEAALRWARPEAERISVGAPAERETAQDAISMLLAEKARDGHTVARLKWGDPFVFDSGGKEALFLYEQGVPFEIVPGVPMAVGATAYAGVPITLSGRGRRRRPAPGPRGRGGLDAGRGLERARQDRGHDRLLRRRTPGAEGAGVAPRRRPRLRPAGRADLPGHAAGPAHDHGHGPRVAAAALER